MANLLILKLYSEMIPKIKSLNLGAIVGCAAGKLADNAKLKELTDTVVHLDTADSSTLKQFFKWVSDTIEQGNKSMGTTDYCCNASTTIRSTFSYMRIIFSYLANIFIIGLFLYSKLLPYKDKLNNQYKGIFNFFNTMFSPILNF
jgi:hypothetical protein